MNINETTFADPFVAPLADDEVTPRCPAMALRLRLTTQVSREVYNDDLAFYRTMSLSRRYAGVVTV